MDIQCHYKRHSFCPCTSLTRHMVSQNESADGHSGLYTIFLLKQQNKNFKASFIWFIRKVQPPWDIIIYTYITTIPNSIPILGRTSRQPYIYAILTFIISRNQFALITFYLRWKVPSGEWLWHLCRLRWKHFKYRPYNFFTSLTFVYKCYRIDNSCLQHS